ncbi:sensor histidine kinase [Mesorhizobium sp. AR07]|uniref:sensor histidine kinase n=1 Tax=Mesorhizobium sp. AR07 TaxID=2865838 RepID=UPI00215E52D6|nr:sensor histidine kinase [Mesorhizobium sp. AR07]UVK46495.1 sensor histidine kinase [Mesorhizobium sp. AR07]
MPASRTKTVGDRDNAFLAGGGQLGCLIATFDWASTSIGPIAGWPQSLKTAVSLTLALAVNELATNALKYGALSTPDGKVSIDWSLQPSAEAAGQTRLIWRWRESGGPPVTPPSRRGFGRFLIERVFGTDFGGSVQIDYHADGVECVLNAPAPQLPTARY